MDTTTGKTGSGDSFTVDLTANSVSAGVTAKSAAKKSAAPAKKTKKAAPRKIERFRLPCFNGQIHTNGRDNFWSLLKRGLKGTYVSVEPFHLFRYLDEQAFRFNNRKDMNDSERFDLAISQIVGKRLTYKETELTGIASIIGLGSCSLLRFGPRLFGLASTLSVRGLSPENKRYWHRQ